MATDSHKRPHHGASDHKRQQFTTPRARRRAMPMVLIGGAAVLFVLALTAAMRPAGSIAAPDISVAAARGADVTLPAANFDDGRARFFRYTTAGGRDVRFFVMKSADGVIRAAFDACDTCFEDRLGYRQQGDVMVCNKCNRTFPSTDINVLQGGCNPAPIERAVVRGEVRLTAAALEAGTALF